MNSKLRKALAMLTVCGLMASGIGAAVYGEPINHMLINGEEKTLTAPIDRGEAGVSIPLRALADALGAKVTWNSADSTVRYEFNEKIYVFTPGLKEVRVNDEQKSMTAPLIIENGTARVPLNAVVDIFEGSLEQADDSYALTIYLQGDKEYGRYTFDELLQRAYANSLDIVKAKNNYERAKLMYNEAADDYIEYPGNDNNIVEDMQRFGNLLNLEGSEISLKTAEIAIYTAREQVKYELKTLLNSLRVAEGAVTLAQEDLAVQRIIQQQNELKYQNGLVSLYDFEKGAETLKTKENALVSKQSERHALRVKLDNLLKLGVDNYEFVAHSEIPYEIALTGDVTQHIQTVLDASPSIFSLEQLVKLKESNLNYYVFNGSMDPYEAIEIDISTAKQNLKIAEDATAVSLKQMGEQLKQLESSYATLQSERTKLQKDYEVAKLNKQVGLITDLNLKQVKLGLNALDQQILSLKGSYEALKLAYDKPWAVQ